MPAKRRHKQPKATAKKLIAANVMAQGGTPEQAAAAAGYKHTDSVRRATRELLQAKNMDDIHALRSHSEARLDIYRRRLCEVAGIIDHEDPDAPQPPPRPQDTPNRKVTAADIDRWRDECLSKGFAPDGSPRMLAESASEVTMAIARLIALEQRRARLLGLDAPKIVAQVSAKSVRTMNNTELVEELRVHGLEVPPGLMEALIKRHRDGVTPLPPMLKAPDAT